LSTSKNLLLSELRTLVKWKKSKAFYAEKLGISLKEVSNLLKQLKDSKQITPEEYRRLEEDIEEGKATLTFSCDKEIKSLDELIIYGKIDTTKWKVTKYVQNYWGSTKNPHWQVKAWLAPITKDENFSEKFIEFLKNYRYSAGFANRTVPKFTNKTALILNKQDAHYNKFDIFGDNDIEERFRTIEARLDLMITKASLTSSVDTIIYIVGSDAFNAEWTKTTTKGTPQESLSTYEDAFEQICTHEVRCIENLINNASEIKVVYVPGNHDEYVGWHLIKWLKTYFRSVPSITFDTVNNERKYIRYHNTALMFNHGDELKPKQLAEKFPMEFKAEWSLCDHFYVFIGDKHHEDMKDISGIKFFQIPPLSNAKSKWDNKKGHTCTKAEMTGFVISETHGMSDIYKEIL
jgi:UDP-2,3-diacylglucosamine pyrophosphatase LpxH